MCGRYALGIRAAFVRRQLQESGMPVEDAPEDDEIRETYNFAPGYHGLVYRADVPDRGAGESRQAHTQTDSEDPPQEELEQHTKSSLADLPGETRYKLQKMKWGLVPFWTKRNPDYGTLMRTINARDDSLAQKGGMWASMKQKKRCIVVAQGFYEWLKKNNGKEKIPHYTKRKDGQLMCFAGLWDCVQYEESDEKHYTYSIITTDVNKQLSFLHDRMPVILENGSDEVRTWLDPKRTEWSKDLQSLLRPFEGELECYPVTKDVSKVGNNSPGFIIPVASSENKHNIANFFGNAKKTAKGEEVKKELKTEESEAKDMGTKVTKIEGEDRKTTRITTLEDNAPLPEPLQGIKREHSEDGSAELSTSKAAKVSPSKPTPTKKTRSATSNETQKPSLTKKDQSQKITSFFKG